MSFPASRTSEFSRLPFSWSESEIIFGSSINAPDLEDSSLSVGHSRRKRSNHHRAKRASAQQYVRHNFGDVSNSGPGDADINYKVRN